MSIIAAEKQELKQLFYHKQDIAEKSHQQLLLQVGETHFGFAITNEDAAVLYELAYCAIAANDSNEWNNCWNEYPSLHQSYTNVLISWDSPAGILRELTAGNDSNASAALLSLNGEACSADEVVIDKIIPWQLQTVYAVPSAFRKFIEGKHPSITYKHQFTTAISNAAGAGAVIQVNFRENDFTAIVVKEGKLKLAQSFPYTTPDDVLFYLLRCCESFSLSQEGTALRLSGLIDQQSALYKELYQYFVNIEFRTVEWQKLPDYPGHFFTSLNDLAKCGS